MPLVVEPLEVVELSEVVVQGHPRSPLPIFNLVVEFFHWHTPKLLNGLKLESKLKTSEKQGVGAHSLACNTLKGRGACWSSEMGLRRVTSINYSHGLAQNQHKVVSA